MKSYRQTLKQYYRVFYWAITFLATAALLFWILPGDPKFKYEYQKGAPWKHEVLVAPFDFAILKQSKEIAEEKQKIETSAIPYFRVDTLTSTHQSEQFENDFRQLQASLPGIDGNPAGLLSGYLKQLYNTGILLQSPESYDVLKGKTEIEKISGNFSQKIEITELYSEKTAYNAFSGKAQMVEGLYPGTDSILKRLDLSGYIRANLNYDSETTQKQVSEAISEISLTRGAIQAGQRIILGGEIVDDEKFTILESLKQSYEKKQSTGFNKYMISGGKMVVILVFLLLIFMYLNSYREEILNQFRRLAFLLFLLVLMVLVSILTNTYSSIHIYAVPFAMLPIVIRTFYDSRTAIFFNMVAALMIGFYAPNSFEYVLLQFSAGTIAVFSMVKMHRRVHIVMAAFWVLLAYLLVYTAINTIKEGTILNVDFRMYLWFAGSSLLIFLLNPLIYIFEKVFGFISDVTLIELSDTNQPLLRKLADEAPGTFQHSMQIANLAEEIILKIGGNPFLVRAGALYHDIGKIAKADYFTENQFGIQNPHDGLPYSKSAEIIIGHVHDGIKMAKKYKLPDRLIEFIATHHGTTKAKYFYLKYKNENTGKEPEGNNFEYPGPLPQSREAAVVMLVDGIEAASRSLEDKNEANLRDLINKMVDQKVNEQQLVDSSLTFRDINMIKKILLSKLINIYHVRIAYPTEEIKK